MRSAVNGRCLRAGPLLRRGPYAHTTCSSLALLRRPSVGAAALHSRAGPNPRQINALIKDATRARELLGLYEQRGQSFNDVNLATCWSRLGRMRGTDRSWLRSDDGTALRALREQTTDQVRTLGARELSNAAHAIAKLDFRGAAWGGLWKEIEGAALARRSELNPQDLANTAWAFATAGRATTVLFDAIGKEAAGRVRDFEPQHLANTAWAFATASHAAPALFDAIGREAAGRVRELNPQDLSNTAWAFATAGHGAPALFDAIGKRGCRAGARAQPSGPVQHGVGVCHGWPCRPGALRRDYEGVSRAGARAQPSEPGQHGVGVCSYGPSDVGVVALRPALRPPLRRPRSRV